MISLAFPSATQVAWLWDDIKPVLSRRAALPSCNMDLHETFARYGLPRHEDRLRWLQRAKGKAAKPVAGCDEADSS